MKKLVHYKNNNNVFIVEGYSALVETLDHPNCTNTKLVRTSPVVKYDEKTGEFETLNSQYKPVNVQ